MSAPATISRYIARAQTQETTRKPKAHWTLTAALFTAVGLFAGALITFLIIA